MPPAPASLSVRLAADPASVPGARRFVVDGLNAWGREDLAEVAELVVSELAGNAALHGAASFLNVTVDRRDDGVRVAVADDGAVGLDAVTPGPAAAYADLDEWSEHATTGRGLAIVSMVAHEWGVELTPRGKRVWAQVTDPDAVNDVRPPTTAVVLDGDGEPQLPPGWVLVRLAGCPVALSLQQDQHLDELIRELQLMAASQDNPQSRALADEIKDLLISPTHARLTGRRLAEQALARGLDEVDIDMAMPPEFSDLVRRLNEAVSRADQLCEDNQLLTVASAPEIRELRRWMTHELTAQIDDGARPITWSAWAAAQARETSQA